MVSPCEALTEDRLAAILELVVAYVVRSSLLHLPADGIEVDVVLVEMPRELLRGHVAAHDEPDGEEHLAVRNLLDLQANVHDETESEEDLAVRNLLDLHAHTMHTRLVLKCPHTQIIYQN